MKRRRTWPMRPAARVCVRMHEGAGFALPAILVAGAGMLFFEPWFFSIGWGATVRPYEWQLNHWLFLVLGAGYAVWSFLRARGAVDPSAGQWFVLAAYGLAMRIYCFVILFGFAPCYGDRSMGEDFADGRARFLIGFHRYGGILAFVLGLGMVAWCSRRVSSGADRAGRSLP